MPLQEVFLLFRRHGANLLKLTRNFRAYRLEVFAKEFFDHPGVVRQLLVINTKVFVHITNIPDKTLVFRDGATLLTAFKFRWRAGLNRCNEPFQRSSTNISNKGVRWRDSFNLGRTTLFFLNRRTEVKTLLGSGFSCSYRSCALFGCNRFP